MNIIVIGAGYVGLVTAVCLAAKGNRVICVERDKVKLDKLTSGSVPIYEDDLAPLLKKTISKGDLSFADSLNQAIVEIPRSTSNSKLMIFIAVGTPQGEDGSADLNYVLEVAREIGQEINQTAIVINKSTVPVGTADLVRGEIAWRLYKRKQFIDFEVVSNPEFLKEGAAIDDFFNPDRIVIGADNQVVISQLSELYSPFVSNSSQLLIVGVKEAELIKYASNAMLATRISFMNEIAVICDRLGIDVELVRRGVGSDSRIGTSFLKAGCGYGGSCFPKDVQALVRIAQSVGVDPLILNAVESRNKSQKLYLFKKITRLLGNNLQRRQFAVWGLAFKPDTDDMREASSIDLIRALTSAGAVVRVHDPAASDVASFIFSDLIQEKKLQISNDAIKATTDADALILVTEWSEYRSADFAALKLALKSPLVFDGRNHLPAEELRELGFTYVGIGR